MNTLTLHRVKNGYLVSPASVQGTLERKPYEASARLTYEAGEIGECFVFSDDALNSYSNEGHRFLTFLRDHFNPPKPILPPVTGAELREISSDLADPLPTTDPLPTVES